MQAKIILVVRANFGSAPSNLVARETINLIFSNAHRLRDFSFRGHHSCLDPLLNLPTGFPNSLEIVTIAGSPDLSFLKGSTKLCELTINNINTQYSSIIQLPLRQLTALHLPWSLLHPRAALSILRQCPSIISCTLGLSDIDGEDAFPDTTPCLLPELTHLKFVFIGSNIS